jgi:exocyst complex component 4
MELDSPSRPLKPPRGNKTGKETGILMRVIKTLSIAATTDHRDREKTKLEKDFRKTDAQLDTLLSTHQPALTSVMNVSKFLFI